MAGPSGSVKSKPNTRAAMTERTRMLYLETPSNPLMRLTDLAAALMTETLEPQGINIGVNQGRAAGAGVPGHLHVHLVPRWGGDTNFLTTVGQIRVLPAALDAMAARYREVWRRMEEE